MTDKVFLNSYQNASTPPPADVPPEQAGFMLAADPLLAQAAELARVVTNAHQSAAVQLVGEGWAYSRKYFSLSEKYAAWSDYKRPATGTGIHAFAHQISEPLRLTDDELRAHPEWRNFSGQEALHPPMGGGS